MRTHLTMLALASGLCAQSAPHTTTIPEIATGAFLGSASSFPLGRTGGKAQYWFRGDGLPTAAITTSIGPRPSRTATSAGRTQSIEITMANTTLAHAGFTKDFALNLGANSTIVHARKNVALPAAPAPTDPNVPVVWITLDAPFLLLGPNLVVDWDLGSAVGAASATPNGDLVTLSGAGFSISSGTSCGSGTLAATVSASSYTLSLTGAVASQPTWLIISGNTRTWGGQPLPYKLDAIGMAGCQLGVDPLIVVTGVADGSGASSLTIPIATPPVAFPVYGQAVYAGAATSLGLATTNVTRTLIGIAGFSSYIYNFTVDGALAQNGPNNWTAPMMFKP